MSWLVYHTRSEEYASEAEKFYRQRENVRAAELYRLAAEAENHALDNLDPGKTRTLGITAVSVVSLYYKAQEFALAKRIAHKWLATELLPPFAIDELEDLLQVIRYEESRVKSGIQFMESEEAPEHRVTQLKGTLRGLQLDQDWIEVNINGENERIYDAKDEIDDVIGPMVNRRVVVEVLERSDRSPDRKYSLRDIQLEEDLL
jgi:hypothetical protein